ncbi:MAG: class I SAM-dependent methyltransferase [Rhodoferax sp.]|nr:class I SAM-dependent methyltransferase [Rhodoferax sp.]
MTDWTDGYVAEIGYTFGYYAELNPLRVRFALLNAGFALPQDATACELGFGQGMSANMHAAASSTRWYGTDFNPSQAAFAQELTQVSGSGARLLDEGFEQFCARTDLPDFDFIGLHGIWSWISDSNRAVIVDFVRRKLKVGGVLYVSYNTQPGWAAMVPLRHLLVHHAQVMGSSGSGMVARVGGALDFAEKLFAVNPAYPRTNAQIPERLKKLREQNRNYLAHEYFNRDWAPMHFAEMADWLTPAKLSYAISAHYPDHIDPINLSAEQQTLLKEIPDPMFRETVRDFVVNQQFRRDYWVKGPRKLAPAQLAAMQRAQRVVLVTPRAAVTLKISASAGEASLNEPIYAPILDVLADHQPHTMAEIEQAVQGKGVSFAQLREAITIYIGKGDVCAAQDDAAVQKALPQTMRLNRHLMELARTTGDISYLASPLTGGGVMVGRFEQLFLLAQSQNRTEPQAWADFVWQILQAEGQRLVKEGKPLNEPAENIAELLRQAQEFAAKRLPILKCLHIA